MRLRSSDDVESYADAVIPFLESDPCVRNVLRWIIELARSNHTGWIAAPSFWWLEDGADVVGALSWTPPYHVLVSEMPERAISGLVGDVAARAEATRLPVTGVTGPMETARAVASAWSDVTGAAIRDERLMLLHELRATREVAHPAGSKRRAVMDDCDLLASWLVAFNEDVGYPVPHDPAATMRAHVTRGRWEVWDVDGEPVSMAGHAEPLAGVVRVTTVYTPPAQRNHGYARRLVADMSVEALRHPNVSRCMLFTEAANPVSNSIYRQIGYEPRHEHADVRFERDDKSRLRTPTAAGRRMQSPRSG